MGASLRVCHSDHGIQNSDLDFWLGLRFRFSLYVHVGVLSFSILTVTEFPTFKTQAAADM